MPGIKVFGRRWAVGSDDFVFPAAAEIILRSAWLLALCIVFGVHNDDLSICTNGNLLRIYYVGMLVILPLEILFSITIMHFSMKGTITNDRPRRHIPNLIMCKLFIFFIEIVWTIMGTNWAFGSHVRNCSNVVINVVKGATVVGWILLLCLVVGIIIVFDSLGNPLTETPSQLQRLWKMRCKVICCCSCGSDVTSNRSSALDEIARLFAEHLIGVDFVITDVAAGMILVQRQQERELRRRMASGPAPLRASYADVAQSKAVLDTSYHPKSWMTLTHASAFMKYALASYGWPFFVYDNQVSGPFKLLCNCKCCLCLRHTDDIFGDNCCGCNTAAILQQTHIRREDIYYANFNNRLYETPFYIIFDHETKSVVLSVRGSLSFDDALTDMLADLEMMSVEGVTDAKAHKGILQAAKYIINTNSDRHLLEEAFERTEGYNLVIVGHSLGAGVAAILAILLKPHYPNLKCFAYSPPGWLLSSTLNNYAKEFVCSVVVGKDLVPRLGLATIQKLKEKMISLAWQSNQPKYRILAGSFSRSIFSCFGSSADGDDEDFDHEAGVVSEPLLRASSARTRTYTEEQEPKDQSHHVPIVEERLYMPGIVLFIEELEPQRGCFEMPTYQAFWMRPDSFDEILVSGFTMVHDHMPNVVYKALKSLADSESTVPTLRCP